MDPERLRRFLALTWEGMAAAGQPLSRAQAHALAAQALRQVHTRYPLHGYAVTQLDGTVRVIAVCDS